MITGGVGTGKTCLLTRYAKLSHLQKKKLISNYHLKLMKYDKLDMVDLYLNHPEISNAVMLGDELYTFMDCRMSMSKRNLIESYLVAQTRKKNFDLYFTAQFSSFVEVRLIRFVDIWVEMSNIWMLNRKTGLKIPHPYLFIAEITDYRNTKEIIQKVMKFNGKSFFKEYDTNERIYPPDDFEITKKAISKKRSKSK